VPQTIQPHTPLHGSPTPKTIAQASVFAAIHQKASLFFIEVDPRPEPGSAGRRFSFASQAEFAPRMGRPSFTNAEEYLMKL
jgi:hypothetical protein